MLTADCRGVDCYQGTHNVLVHTGAIRNLKLWNEQEGHVANLQSKLSYVKNNRDVYNKAGAKLAVVHQYDRYPELQKTLFEKVCWFYLLAIIFTLDLTLRLYPICLQCIVR